MKQPISKLKEFFGTFKMPTALQFGDLLDSFFHKDGKIPAANIEGWTDDSAVNLEPNVMELPELASKNKSVKVLGGAAGKTYTYKGTQLTINPNYEGILFWDGALKVWKIQDQAPLAQPEGVDVINPTGQGVPKEIAVAKFAVAQSYLLKGQNTYNYLEDIEGYYIDARTGVLIANATSAVSKPSPCVPDEIVYIKNRDGATGIRFLNATGTPLPPLDVNGNPFAEPGIYQPPYIDGGYKAPAGTVSRQFTTKFTGTTNRQNTIASDSPNSVVSIKETLIPDTPKVLAVATQSQQSADYITSLDSAPPSQRINKRENTNTPEFFGAATELLNQFAIQMVPDTESPVRTYLPYMRKCITTQTANGASNYRIANIVVGTTNRPVQIDFSFWVKKTLFQAIFTDKMTSYLGLKAWDFSVVNLLSGMDVIATTGTTYPNEYSAAVAKAKIISEVNGWIRISINYSGIVWKDTFAGATILYYFMFNGASPNGKDFYFTDFTVLFGERAFLNIIYPSDSDNLVSNSKSLKGMNSRIDSVNYRIDDLINENSKPVSLKYSAGYIYVSTQWDNIYNLVRRANFRPNWFLTNPNFNLVNDYLSDKSLKDSKVSSVIIKDSGDDCCPVNVFGSYIAGNHGWGMPRKLILANHGKTHYDVGAVYTDNNGTGIDFVVLNVPDVNTIYIIAVNQATDGFSYTFPKPVGKLVYKENGRDTVSIENYNADDYVGNLYPCMSPSTAKILLDGTKEVTADGDYRATYVDVVESYYIYDLPSIIAAVRSNRPVGGYTANPLYNTLSGLEYFGKYNVVYRFLADGTTVISLTFVALKKCSFNFFGFTQAYPMANSKLYVPKSLPITSGARTFDFRKIEDWNTAPAGELHLTSQYWENPNSPPDRVVNISPTAIFSTGYILDRGKGLNRKNNVQDAIFLHTSRKLYPKGDSVARVMLPLESTSMVSYRSYNNPANNPVGRTNLEIIEWDSYIQIKVDYHGSLEDSIKARPNWVGRKIEVVEKTSNITILSDVVANVIEINSLATAAEYGYIVLKLTN